MFPMVTTVEDWDAAMRVVERCRDHLKERGVPFNEDTKFGVMLSVPSACLTAEDFVAHGVDFLVIGTNDLTQYTHAVSRELAIAEHYYRPASPAMKKLIAMVESPEPSGHQKGPAGCRNKIKKKGVPPRRDALFAAYHSRFPVRVMTAETTARGAVSQRRMRGPRPTVFAPACAAISASSAAKPPSAPVMTASFSFWPSAGFASASSWRRGAPPHS